MELIQYGRRIGKKVYYAYRACWIANSYPMRTRGIVKYYIESQRAKSYDVTIYNNKTRPFTDLHYLFVRVSQKEI